MLEEDRTFLDALVLMMPNLKDFFIGDVAMCLSDCEKYIYYKPGKDIDHKIKAGDPLVADGIAEKCLKAKSTIISDVDAKLFGFPCMITGTPVYNSKKEVIGAILISESADVHQNRQQFKNISNEISRNMNILVQNINSLRNQSENISLVTKNLKQKTEESKEQVQETNDMLNLIKSIAYKTNLLGINAAIEATRVGTEGAGFKVVSDEIRKLSVNTDDSVKKIEPIIKQVHANSNFVAEKISEINTSATSFVELINQTIEMAKLIGELSSSIDTFADSLLKSSNK